MCRSALLIILAVTMSSCHRNESNSTDPTPSIRAVLEQQQAAWNRGDIDTFMQGYDRADTTTFVSGDEVTRGWQTVLDRYKRRYSTPEQMGKLTFSDLEVHLLGEDHAMADGRWQLDVGATTPHGRFTLIFKQTADGWRIVHDTTTAAQ